MNINELLISNDIAKNDFQASHIANGLKLWQLKTDEEKLERAKLYRKWRNSKVYPKNDTASCYKMAIKGEAVPQIDFTETLSGQSAESELK